MAVSYTQKTLAYLRDHGWYCQVVERYCSFTHRRKDLFGIIDIVAVKDGQILGVQSTGPNGRSDHRIKMLAAEGSLRWLLAGGELWLMSWRKLLVKRGGKARRWQPAIDILKVEDLKYEPDTDTNTEPNRQDGGKATDGDRKDRKLGTAA